MIDSNLTFLYPDERTGDKGFLNVRIIRRDLAIPVLVRNLVFPFSGEENRKNLLKRVKNQIWGEPTRVEDRRSLRRELSLLLPSLFPMFLKAGEENKEFYGKE